jgi:hypothetical protein
VRPGFGPWSNLGDWFEPAWLSTVVRAGTLPVSLVAYLPSFYRPCRIMIVEWPEAAEISIVQLVGELSALGRDQLRNDGWPQQGPPPDGLERWEETGRADQPQIKRFHESLPVSIPLRPEDSACPGCDGMDIYCWFRWGNRIGATRSWQDH